VTPALKEKVFENIQKHLGVRLPTSPGLDTIASVDAAYNGSINVAVLLGGNLFGATPNRDYTEKALDNIPFKVFLNTTMNKGHVSGINKEVIILSVAARDEEKQSTTQESMFSFVRLSDGGIVRLNNVRSEVDIISDIAIGVLGKKQLDSLHFGGTGSRSLEKLFKEFKNHTNIRKAIAATIPGFEKMETIDDTREEFQIEGRTFHEPEFATKDKKANFRVVAMPRSKNGWFRLMTVRSEGQFNTIIYEEKDIFRGQDERWVVMMNKEDIKSLGLKENDKVKLQNGVGKMENVKVREFDIARGNLMAYYPEANVLIPTDTDGRSKTPAFKSTLISVCL